jgi:hypothetical protein
MLDRLGVKKPYICIDTFDGFVDRQFATDVALGTPLKDQDLFSGNSKELVAKILHQHKCDGVELLQGDVTAVADEVLPNRCSAVLIDVDLTEPTYVSLQRFWPRLAAGGSIMVDDCQETTSWKARMGYSRFCSENNLPEQYLYGMGLLMHEPAKPARRL